MDAIQTFQLTKRFPLQTGWGNLLRPGALGPPVVDGVSLAVRERELFGLLGPNGAGKTTLVKMLATLIEPTSGEAWIHGVPLREAGSIKADLGLVTSDERSFYWRLTGEQNLLFFAALHGMSGAASREAARWALEQVDLQDAAHTRFGLYSTGMRQRLSLARALLTKPKLLFLDEPARGLDPGATRKLHHLIRSLPGGGVTVFLTTHDLAEAELLCDRIAILHHGKLQACGAVADLRQELSRTGLFAAGDRYTLRVRGLPQTHSEPLSGGDLTIHASANGESEIELASLSGDGRLDQTVDWLRASGASIQSIQSTPLSLEAIFDHFTSEGMPHPADTAGSPAAAAAPLPAPSRQVSLPKASPRRPSLLKVAAAFLQRDWQEAISYRVAFLFQFLSVFFSVAIFYFIAQVFGAAAAPFLEPYGGDYFSFVLIGIAFAGYFGAGLSSFANSLRSAQTAGTLEAMLATPARLSHLLVASSLWDYAMISLRVLVYLGLGAACLGVDLRGSNFAGAGLVLLLTVLVFSSLGILAASFVMVLKRGNPVTWVVNTFSTLLGGVYYPVAVLPAFLQAAAALLPITYALHALRLALLQGAPLAELLPDLLALGAFGLVLLPASLLAFRWAVRRARVEGSLTQY